MKGRPLRYRLAETAFVGELFDDPARTGASSGTRPGVVVFPEAFGLNDHARARAARLAQAGYVALAADPHGDGQLFDDMEALRPRMQALYADRAAWRARARAPLDALLALPQVDRARTGAIGFCFGGTTCIELARSGAPLAAVATFHAGLLPGLPEDAGRIRARMMICHGAEDPLVQKQAIDAVMAEFRRDHVDWQFTFYGNAAHSFSDPAADGRGIPGLKYDARAESRSWAALGRWFEEAFQ